MTIAALRRSPHMIDNELADYIKYLERRLHYDPPPPDKRNIEAAGRTPLLRNLDVLREEQSKGLSEPVDDLHEFCIREVPGGQVTEDDELWLISRWVPTEHPFNDDPDNRYLVRKRKPEPDTLVQAIEEELRRCDGIVVSHAEEAVRIAAVVREVGQ